MELKLKIVFSIIRYKSFDDNIEIIKLLDLYFLDTYEQVYGTDIYAGWKKSDGMNYDYVCTIYNPNVNFEKIKNYIKHKFAQAQNYIKFNYDTFGTEWYIDYKIIS